MKWEDAMGTGWFFRESSEHMTPESKLQRKDD